MSKRTVERDLFGRPVQRRKSRLEFALEKYDMETLSDRVGRLRWVDKILPKGYAFMMPPETAYIFDEAKMAFINGEFIGTLLLASAFVEHWLGMHLESKGYQKEAQKGLAAIIDCARTNSLVHGQVLNKADHLREIRNPFVHLKPFAYKHRVTQRAMSALSQPVDLMERDAKEALSIMYTIARASFH